MGSAGPDRTTHYAAWALIATAAGKSGELGRINALENLNRDGVSLDGIDLSKAVLPGIKLPGVSLRFATFDHTQLSDAKFACDPFKASISRLLNIDTCTADFYGVTFKQAELANVDLGHSSLDRVNFISSNLYNPNMRMAHLKYVDFRNLVIAWRFPRRQIGVRKVHRLPDYGVYSWDDGCQHD
jgi:uncharacterized protein YjbI with pentapeptide repeats